MAEKISKSIDRVSFALQTGSISPVEPVSVLRLLGGLLPGPLLLALPLTCYLIRSPHAAQQRSCTGANGRTPSGVPCDSPGNRSNCCTAGAASDQSALGRFPGGWGRSGPGCRQGIKAGLLPGPILTLCLVPIHLLLALSLAGKNKEILCRRKLDERKQNKQENRDGQYRLHDSILSSDKSIQCIQRHHQQANADDSETVLIMISGGRIKRLLVPINTVNRSEHRCLSKASRFTH